MSDGDDASLRRTPLDALHRELGARMVAFAGYAMPVQYPRGIIAEHTHTRTAAGLFDVSHMGQAVLHGDDPAAALERLVPGDIRGLAPGQMRYTLLLNEDGGIIDDFMATRAPEPEAHRALVLVVNAARKDVDFAHIARALDGTAQVQRADDRALLAVQGPEAAAAVGRLAPAAVDLAFMHAAALEVDGAECFVSRSGYTGEDGFEISVPAEAAEGLARTLLEQPEVEPVGLGARDSLRLEAGLCLYGHDLDEETTPVEARLAWTIARHRRERGDFPGGEAIVRQLRDGPPRRRVGLRPEGRAPVREGAELTDGAGEAIGRVTSGGYGPTVGGPIAMGYVARGHDAEGGQVSAVVRGTPRPCRVVKPRFIDPRARQPG